MQGSLLDGLLGIRSPALWQQIALLSIVLTGLLVPGQRLSECGSIGPVKSRFRTQGGIMADPLLIDVDDSLLVVVDVQAVFLDKLPEAESAILLERICWLIGVARWAGVPQVVMAEDISSNGSIHPAVADALARATVVHDKGHFGLAAEESIFQAVVRSARKTAIIIGLETDVCVCQSALGLLEHDYRVVVIADAVGSPGPDHAYGLQRMRAAGVAVAGVKGLFYEWLRTVARSEQFHAECGERLPTPSGVRL
ncbi:MAG: isochorismatase family protein [Gammaproteobacteria bacterium]|nr:isochorismatase family protein [Gammaproteobacteria bacterium]MDX2460707.1 isochorismatase family protein [Gammaproteobacteria bacterium]